MITYQLSQQATISIPRHIHVLMINKTSSEMQIALNNSIDRSPCGLAFQDGTFQLRKFRLPFLIVIIPECSINDKITLASICPWLTIEPSKPQNPRNPHQVADDTILISEESARMVIDTERLMEIGKSKTR